MLIINYLFGIKESKNTSYDSKVKAKQAKPLLFSNKQQL